MSTSAVAIFKSPAVRAAYGRAQDFCRSVQKPGITPYPTGVVPVSRLRFPRGSVEVRGLVGKDYVHEAHSLPLPMLLENKAQLERAEDINLLDLDMKTEATLDVLVAHNAPSSSYPADLVVRRINMKALSPTSQVWMRWTQEEEGGMGLFVSGNKLLHFAKLSPGINELLDITLAGNRIVAKGPFNCRLQDFAQNYERMLQLRFFLFPRQPDAEILELNAKVVASRLGSYSTLPIVAQ